MYRIVFEPTTARWLVQILSFHLFWRTVKTESEFKVLPLPLMSTATAPTILSDSTQFFTGSFIGF